RARVTGSFMVVLLGCVIVFWRFRAGSSWRQARLAGSIDAVGMAVAIARLAVVLFVADVAVGDVERALEAAELAGIDDAICAEMAFHGANFALFVHQLAVFRASQP